jgi:arsenate reductase
MKHLVFFVTLVCLPMLSRAADLPAFFDGLQPTVDQMAAAGGEVSAERREILDDAAKFIAQKLRSGDDAKLTFICTHNSRRSHLAQIWAAVAADYYGLAGVKTYSGGTEATACNPRTVGALRRAGLQAVRTSDDSNPQYMIQYAENRPPLSVFSKVYNSPPNPERGYAGMMCCAAVDEQCAVVYGAEVRIPLHYVDPKVADDTTDEAATYDECSEQIGVEMFYVLARAAALLGRK